MSAEHERLAAACILPGFAGPTPPEWVLRRIAGGLGGVVLFAWNVESREQLATLTAGLRAENERILVAIDEEGGDVTRLEAGTGSSYPGNAALGAVDDPVLTERVAAAIGADLAEVGVTLNLAPVADVNTNPDNPVIGVRSFGARADLVARQVAAFVRGLQAGGVGACAKHFPGHGDTAVDSHLDLPVVESVSHGALLPFRAAIDAGATAIMTAHLLVRSVGPEPATTSRALLHDLLRSELGFGGLVVTDALEMRAVSATVGIEEAAVRAIEAGADALCLGHDLFDDAVQSVSDALVDAVRAGRLAESRLEEAASRVDRASRHRADRASSERVDRAIGEEAARRALEVHGDLALTDPPLVVELAPEPGIAAGTLGQSPGDWFRSVVPEAEVVRLERADLDAPRVVGDRPLVVLLRDAHRHAWQRDLVAAMLARSPDVILVETGLPVWRPPGAPYIATYGAGRVNVVAAAERLYSRSRRGVEQSGSSPGS